ncbi:stathmin 1b [Myripristis murdjan]|uniref:stathmin 1b n=1 Tax=Myripristis murdjan TaxID=586833 RepID=UPI001175C958|nr:stathmin-like [Myripristis murdjan]
MASGELQIKELDRRTSGEAFEVILSPATPDAKSNLLLSPSRRKETTLEEIQEKLDAAEGRRKKAMEDKTTSSKMERAEKMKANKENRTAQMAAFSEKLKEKEKRIEEIQKNRKKTKGDM